MRRSVVFSTVAMFASGGCVLFDTYDYSGYGGQGNGGSAGANSTSSESSSSVASSSSSVGGGGGMHACPPAEICNHDSDPSCAIGGDCKVDAAIQNRFGDGEDQQVRAVAVISGGMLLMGGEYAGNPTFAADSPLPPAPSMKSSAFAALLDANAGGIATRMFTSIGTTLGVARAAADWLAIGHNDASTGGARIFVERHKTLPSGTAWRHDFGSYQDGSDAMVTSLGGENDPVYIAGNAAAVLESNSTLCPGFMDPPSMTVANPFVFQLNPSNGQCNWGFTLGGGVITGMSVVTGQVIIVGYYLKTENIRLNPRTFPSCDACVSAFIAAYDTTSAPNAPKEPLWLHTYAIKESEGFFKLLSVTADNNHTYVAGTLKGSFSITDGPTIASAESDADLVVMAFESVGGKFVWAHRLGGPGTQEPQSILAISNGMPSRGIYLAGYHHNDSPMSMGGMAIVEDQAQGQLCLAKRQCLFLMKWNENGKTVWAREFGADETGKNPTVRLAADTDSLWMAATRASDVDFGLGTLSSAGEQDVFVAKFSLGGLPN